MSDSKFTSFRELFLRNKRGLLTFLTRRVGREEASDLLQETFVRALRHDRFENVDDSTAFLKQIAVNLTRDFARRRKTETRYLDFGDPPVETPSEAATPEESLDRRHKTRIVLETIDALPPRCREVCLLVMHEGVSVNEAARRLGISETMARRHLRLALLRCRAALD
ncbi:RNA polymerase sigma factor [Methylosinus sporium]|uniref:RNA polymerase sigma factor n=1 Tax=Methylosinus sporium TaxID=428 RepID=A0A549SS94_METSR|nr:MULTISPECIES: RNA polymerase sigma factor [Methylosinus]MBU3889664.1 RNA polymerase sigma factor [Methylosinus sp. KRF6]TRL32491.1 RNA polymerase sigma factor [Methylosinus sporium]